MNVTDSAAGRPAHFAITGLSLAVEAIASDTAIASRVRTALTWQGTGTLSAQGAVNIWQKRGELAVTQRSMSLAPFDAYLAPRVKLLISDGALSATAKLRVDVADSNKPDISFTGDVRVDKFATTDDVAKGPFVSFGSLEREGDRLLAAEVPTRHRGGRARCAGRRDRAAGERFAEHEPDLPGRQYARARQAGFRGARRAENARVHRRP